MNNDAKKSRQNVSKLTPEVYGKINKSWPEWI